MRSPRPADLALVGLHQSALFARSQPVQDAAACEFTDVDERLPNAAIALPDIVRAAVDEFAAASSDAKGRGGK